MQPQYLQYNFFCVALYLRQILLIHPAPFRLTVSISSKNMSTISVPLLFCVCDDLSISETPFYWFTFDLELRSLFQPFVIITEIASIKSLDGAQASDGY